MASKEFDFIAFSKLHGMVQGGSSASPAKGLFFGESLTKVYRAYMGGDIVWDSWKAILSAPDFSVPAKAVEVKDHIQVESKGTDYEKVSHSMPYTLSPESIGKNTSSLARTVDVTIQQTQSKEKIVVKATQSANQVSEVKFDIPTVVSASASVVPAKGGVSTLTVSWSQVKTTNYSNGSSTTETLTGTSVATVTNGGDIVTGSKIENGKVSVPSAGTSTYNGSRKAYTIMAYTFTVNGVKKNVSGVGIVVMQSQNSVSYSYATPVLTATYTDVGANGSAASLTLKYTQVRTNSYTSEVPPTTTSLSGTISKTATSGIYISAISGSNNKNGASVVVTSGSSSRGNVTADNLTTNPTSRAEVLKVSISASVNGKSATVSVSVYQQANVRTETGKTGGVTTYGNVVAGKITNATIPASGGNATATAGNGSQSWSTTAVETSYTHTSGSPLTLVTTAASSGTDTIYPSHASLYASALQKPASDSPVTTVKSQAVTWSGSGNKSASGTMYVYQQANVIKSYGDVTVVSHGSVASDIPASGGSRTASGGSGKQTITYTSNATRAGSVTCGTYSTVSAGTLGTTPTSRTKKGTSSATLTGEGGKTATVSVDVYQQANVRTETGKTGGVTTYGNVVAGKITNATIPASGGNATATAGNGSQSWSTTAVETSYTHTSGSPLTLVTTAASSGTDTIYPSHASLYASALQKPASDSPVTTVKSQAVTWNGSGNKSASGTMYVYQQANAVTSYGAITINSHGSVASDIPASGGSRAASGGSGSQTVTYTSKATRAGSVTCGTYSTVSAGSLGTTPKSRTKIGTSSAKLTGEGGMTATVSVDVHQQANARSANPTSYGSWVVDCSHYNGVTTNIVATGGTMQVIVNSYRVNTYTWTSAAEEKITQYGTGTITKTNIDSLSATSFTGKSGGVVITATIGENPTKDQRSCTVTATSNSVTKSASRTQNASVFALSATPPLAGHGGGNYTLQIISTRNGKAFKPSVSVSGISGASVVSITLATDVSTTGLYYCVISFPANSSTSSRTLTASISQTGGNSTTASITQSGVPVTILGIGYYAGGFAFYKNPLNGSINYNRLTVSGKWSSEGPEWTGGTLVDARAVVSNTNTGTGTVISSLPLGSITLPQDGLADFGDNGAGLRGSEQAKYVLLYWGSPSQLNQVVEIPPAGAEPKT